MRWWHRPEKPFDYRECVVNGTSSGLWFLPRIYSIRHRRPGRVSLLLLLQLVRWAGVDCWYLRFMQLWSFSTSIFAVPIHPLLLVSPPSKYCGCSLGNDNYVPPNFLFEFNARNPELNGNKLKQERMIAWRPCEAEEGANAQSIMV